VIRAKFVTARPMATRVRITIDIPLDQYSHFNAILDEFHVGLTNAPDHATIKVNSKPAKVPTPAAPTPLEAKIQEAMARDVGQVVTEITLAADEGSPFAGVAEVQYDVELVEEPQAPAVSAYESRINPDDDEGSPFDGAR